jgi:hypothetical protein
MLDAMRIQSTKRTTTSPFIRVHLWQKLATDAHR